MRHFQKRPYGWKNLVLGVTSSEWVEGFELPGITWMFISERQEAGALHLTQGVP